jgi:hypothetical protein
VFIGIYSTLNTTSPAYYLSTGPVGCMDKGLLGPSASVLWHYKCMSIIGVLTDDTDPLVASNIEIHMSHIIRLVLIYIL